MALKFISKHGKSAKDIRNLRQEIAILRTLNHENIILMFDAFETEREFCVVTEYAQVPYVPLLLGAVIHVERLPPLDWLLFCRGGGGVL